MTHSVFFNLAPLNNSCLESNGILYSFNFSLFISFEYFKIIFPFNWYNSGLGMSAKTLPDNLNSSLLSPFTLNKPPTWGGASFNFNVFSPSNVPVSI